MIYLLCYKMFLYGMVVIVMATIVGVVENDNWWYTGCQKCNKSVNPDSNMYYCRGCDTHVINVTSRFLICLGHLVNEYFVQQIYNYKLFTIILQFRFLLKIWSMTIRLLQPLSCLIKPHRFCSKRVVQR